MCLFPNLNLSSDIAYHKGVTHFPCGACPECLSKRSSSWALRSVYESKAHAYNCMVTLTYDTFVRDDKGEIVKDSRGVPLENPVDPDLRVNRRDIQLFIKRLRKWYGKPLKYIACAEYGSRTHRAHYHLILFGVRFDDAHYYKKSSRGNPIYMSNTLTRLWNHGICTIDSIRVHSAIARYCTKYCAKSRSDETFMLASQKLGLDELMKDFNGINYMIDGRQYPIPRVIWQKYITDKYPTSLMDYRYVNKFDSSGELQLDKYYDSLVLRNIYMYIRDNDPVYQRYLAYWQRLGSLYDSHKPCARQRIYNLPDSKYHFYKIAALRVLDLRKYSSCYPAPGSGCVSSYFRERYLKLRDLSININLSFENCPLAPSSCPNRASDTNLKFLNRKLGKIYYELPDRFIKMEFIQDIPPNFVQIDQQLGIDI